MRVTVLPRMETPSGGKGLCYGRSEDWHSRSPLAQAMAQTTCWSCPERWGCARDLDRVLARGVIVEGQVWAGRVFPFQDEEA